MDAGGWDERYAGTQLVWGAEPNRWVVQETEGLEPGRAIDLACGEGRNAIWLARRGWQVTGVDFSAVGLDRAVELTRAADPADGEPLTITWAHADVRTLELPEDGFELVLLAYLHLPAAERRTVLRSAAAGLAPGGSILVVGHDSTNLAEGVGGPQDPEVLFTAQDVAADLAAVVDDGRLLVDTARRLPREVATESGTKTAWDAVFRGHRPA